MKIFKIILGIIIAFSTLQVFFTDTLQNEQGAGLYGSMFGLLLILGLSFWLIYSGAQNKNPKMQSKSTPQTRDRVETSQSKNGFDSKIENLKSLRDSNVLSESEYQDKVIKINDEQLDDQITKTEEYIRLKALYTDGVFDKEEFESKVKIVKYQLSEWLKNNVNKEKGFRVAGNLKCGLAMAIDEDLNYGFVDENNKTIIDFNYQFARDFKEGIALIKRNNCFGFINTKGEEVIKPQFYWVDEFSEELCTVKNYGQKFGFIDGKGSIIIDYQFDHAYQFINGVSKVKVKKLWGLINKKGNFIQTPKYKKSTDF